MKKTKKRNQRKNRALRRRRTNAIILWIISIGLLLSMVIAFTPTLGLGRFNRANNPNALIVNGEPISEAEVSRARQNQLYNLASEGEAADDLQALMLDELINNEIIRQASSSTGVSNSEVRQAVNEFREQIGAAGPQNDSIYLREISRRGFSDQSFRAYMKQQRKQEKYLEGLTEDISVNDDEVEVYFEANRQAYLSEEKIKARQIVVEDESLAEELHARVVAGDDFADLAKEHSVEAAEQGGAIGGDDPTPVARLALPTAVADAAFGLGDSGITEVINAAGLYHIVKVEEFIAGEPRPFDEVAEEAKEDALEVKRAGVVEAEIKSLRENINIEVVEGTNFPYENPVVARVGEVEITRAELARATYLSPQVRNLLSPQNLSFVTQFFKPNSLSQLIDQELAYQGAQELDAEFFGTKGNIAQSALAHISKDVEITEEDQQTYYEENEQDFTIPASALTSQVTFANQEEAEAFRKLLLAGEVDLADLESSIQEYDAGFEDLGTVSPGMLEPELDTPLFEFEGESFEGIPEEDWEVSELVVVEKVLEPEETDEDAVEEGDESDEQVDDSDSSEETEDSTNEIEITPTSEELESVSEEEEVSDEEASVTDEEEVEGVVGDEISEEEKETDGTDEELAETSEEEADSTTEEEASEEEVDITDSSDDVDEDVTSEPETIEEYVLLVATRTPERLQSLEEVQEQVEELALDEKRNELQQSWLDELREKITVENLLAPEVEEEITEKETEEEITEEAEEEPSLADLFTTDPLPEDVTEEGLDFESMPPTSSTPLEESSETTEEVSEPETSETSEEESEEEASGEIEELEAEVDEEEAKEPEEETSGEDVEELVPETESEIKETEEVASEEEIEEEASEEIGEPEAEIEEQEEAERPEEEASREDVEELVPETESEESEAEELSSEEEIEEDTSEEIGESEAEFEEEAAEEPEGTSEEDVEELVPEAKPEVETEEEPKRPTAQNSDLYRQYQESLIAKEEVGSEEQAEDEEIPSNEDSEESVSSEEEASTPSSQRSKPKPKSKPPKEAQN